MTKGTLDRVRIPDNILEREVELRERVGILERLIGAAGQGGVVIGGAGVTSVTAGLALIGGGTGDVTLDLNLAVPSGLIITADALAIDDTIAGAGLTITAKVLAVGQGDGLTVTADLVSLTLPGTVSLSTVNTAAGNHTHEFDETGLLTSTANVIAGTGLTSTGTLATGITINLTGASPSGLAITADSVAIDDSIAGIGLYITSKVLNVGVSSAFTTTADAIGLALPGSVSVSSVNLETGNHTHAVITSSAITTATAVITATNASGYLQLLRLGAGIAPTVPLHALATGNETGLQVEAPGLTGKPAMSILNLPLSTDVNTGKGFEIKVTGEDSGRVMFYSDGKFGIGPGTATRDTFLSRTAAGTWLVSTATLTAAANMQFNNGAWIGLGAAAGRITFVDAANDLVRILGADLHMSDGTTDTLKIRRSGLVNSVESDIYANERLGLAADDDVGIFIDASNTHTDSYFAILKDAEIFPSATQVFSVDEAFTATIGNGTGAPAYVISGAAGNVRDVRWQTNGVNRWILRTGTGAEAGSNAGSDFEFLARADDGSAIAAAISIQRSTGAVQVGSPTGGYKGAGTINAKGIYDDNVLLTDHILDLFYDGRMSQEDAIKYPSARLWNIQETAEFTRLNRHLPTMPGRAEWEQGSKSLGQMVTALWETVEQQQLQIFELQERIYGNA